jgi:hypothetical protein
MSAHCSNHSLHRRHGVRATLNEAEAKFAETWRALLALNDI